MRAVSISLIAWILWLAGIFCPFAVEGRPDLPVNQVLNPVTSTVYSDDNALASINGIACEHDARGNMTKLPLALGASATTSTLSFDWRDRLVAVGNSMTYTYDHENLRVKMTRSKEESEYVFDPHGGPLVRMLMRKDSDGKIIRERIYSPVLGRFISMDPARFEGGMNWYAYADGNPMRFADPTGLDAEDTLDALQSTLEVVGMLPIIGPTADLINAGISLARGNDEEAGMHFLSARFANGAKQGDDVISVFG